MQDEAFPAVRQIDHVNIVTDAPGALAETLSHVLGLPLSSPLLALPVFDLAILAAGNVTIEIQLWGWRRGILIAPHQAHLAAIVFDADDFDTTLAELRRRKIVHLAPLVFRGEATQIPAYDTYRHSPNDPAWRVSLIDGILGRKRVSTRLTARPLVATAPGATRFGRIMGGIAGQRSLGRLMAPIFTPAPPFTAVVEWGHDVPARRLADRVRLAEAQAPGLGITGMCEVTIAVSDMQAARRRWASLLGTSRQGSDRWTLGDGPAIRLVHGQRDEITGLVFAVGSLSRAREGLMAAGLCDDDAGHELILRRQRVAGLDLRLRETAA